ncbi:MAG: efflux RND transporter periplasmic adaptor subunit [Chitinophagaceae bacterium]|nr:MAG: efflux RND transporter periplasmic adaptor subunit [Chitinophagaceae bacterium]
MNYKPLCILLLGSTLSLGACKSNKEDKKTGESKESKSSIGGKTIQVNGYIVKSETFSEKISVPGTIVSSDAIEIHPEVSGRVVQLNVRDGAYVQKGQVLAKIYDGDLQARLNKLYIQEKIAQNNEDRANQLLKIEGISRQDYETSLLNLNNIKADISILKTEIARTVVHAPFSGKLGLRAMSQGAYVSPASVIATISKTSDLKLDFTVPEKYVSQIKTGNHVNFTIEGSTKQYTATIIATEPSITVDNRTLTVRANVLGSQTDVLAGSFAEVVLSFVDTENSVFVPSQALVPTARGKQIILFKSGKALFNDVTTGYRDTARVAILTGVAVGDTIVTSNIMSMKPNTAIKINQIVN